MIFVNDIDHTEIAESKEECLKHAIAEKHNPYYDIGDRDVDDAAEHRFIGKFTESYLAMRLNQLGFIPIHGVRYGKKFADNGSDLTFQDQQTNIFPIQVKSCTGNYLNFYSSIYSTATEKVQKLCLHPGPIVITKIDTSKKNQPLWYITDGQQIFVLCKQSFHIGDFYVPLSALGDKITNWTYQEVDKLLIQHCQPISYKTLFPNG